MSGVFYIQISVEREILFKQMANKPLSPQLLSKFNNIANYRTVYVNPFMCLLHIFNVTSQRDLWNCWAMAAKLHPDHIPSLGIVLRLNLLGFLLAIQSKANIKCYSCNLEVILGEAEMHSEALFAWSKVMSCATFIPKGQKEEGEDSCSW